MRLAMLFLFLSMLLISPERCTDAARSALSLWSIDIVPSLFPYMVLCKLSSEIMSQSGVPAIAAVPFLGLLGGSPGGAAALSSFSCQQPMKSNTFRALCVLTGGVSPAFLLSTMRRWGLNTDFCRSLAMICITASVLSSLIIFMRPQRSMDTRRLPQSSFQEKATDPIMQSVASILGVGGCLVFFSVAAEWASILLGPIAPPLFSVIIHALLEMAGGIHKLCILPIDQGMLFILCAFFAGFSGISILVQNHQQLVIAGISVRQLLYYALFRGGIAALLAFILTCLPS